MYGVLTSVRGVSGIYVNETRPFWVLGGYLDLRIPNLVFLRREMMEVLELSRGSCVLRFLRFLKQRNIVTRKAISATAPPAAIPAIAPGARLLLDVELFNAIFVASVPPLTEALLVAVAVAVATNAVSNACPVGVAALNVNTKTYQQPRKPVAKSLARLG